MLVEIHMLQNHAPSNLNRDDSGSPKDCIFGGVRRSRISSQSLKRAIRRSPLFRQSLVGVDLAVRTRQLPSEVRRLLLERGLSEDLADIAAQKASGFGNKDGKEQEELETAQVMFLSPADIQAVADTLYEAARECGTAEALKKLNAKDLQEKAELKGWRPVTPDIALFGRMITSKAFRDVEAAMQVAHAISTHKMDQEFDYFTAVDDLLRPTEQEDDRGASMIGDIEFNSACYYKYFSLDMDDLVRNLAGDEPGPRASAAERSAYEDHLAQARELARQTALAFLRAAVFTTPTGKQNTFAAHQLPDAILVEVREQNIPISYANAFVKPVVVQGGKDLVELSLSQFADHVERLTRKFCIKNAGRLWFTTREVSIAEGQPCETLDDLLGAVDEQLKGRLRHG